MKTPLSQITLPPKNNPLPAWMEKPATLPEWMSEMPPRIVTPEDVHAFRARLAQAQRDIPENAFADSPVSLTEKLLIAGLDLCGGALFVSFLACFF